MGVFLVEYRFANRALGTIRSFFDEPALPVPKHPKTPKTFSIVMDNVNFAHAAEATLIGLSLIIRQGSVVALVGPSGAGKTTLVSLISRLWDVDSGAVR